MKDLVSGIRYDASNVISQAIGPSKEFCMGYLNPGVVGGEGYISTMKLSVGTVDVKDLDAITERIVAKDRCEKNDAYLGQVNLMKASSFCGQNGAIWGFDLAMHDDIAKRKEISTCRHNPKERTSLFIISVRCWRQPNVCSAVPRSAVSLCFRELTYREVAEKLWHAVLYGYGL